MLICARMPRSLGDADDARGARVDLIIHRSDPDASLHSDIDPRFLSAQTAMTTDDSSATSNASTSLNFGLVRQTYYT